MDYGTSDYWGMNCNGMPAAMVLMVQILVVNNWMVFVEAYGAIGHVGAWVLFLVFLVFRFLGAIAGVDTSHINILILDLYVLHKLAGVRANLTMFEHGWHSHCSCPFSNLSIAPNEPGWEISVLSMILPLKSY